MEKETKWNLVKSTFIIFVISLITIIIYLEDGHTDGLIFFFFAPPLLTYIWLDYVGGDSEMINSAPGVRSKKRMKRGTKKRIVCTLVAIIEGLLFFAFTCCTGGNADWIAFILLIGGFIIILDIWVIVPIS